MQSYAPYKSWVIEARIGEVCNHLRKGGREQQSLSGGV